MNVVDNLDEEIQTHLAMRVEELLNSGVSPAAARQEALRRFGDLEDARHRLYQSARARATRLYFSGL